MKSNINLKQESMIMKKLSIIIMLLVLMLSSGYSAMLDTTQSSNILEYRTHDKGNSFYYSFAGSINEPITFTNSNNTYYYDIDWELDSVTEDFFIIIRNYFPNNNGTFIFHGDLTRNPNAYIQPFTMNETGTYYFKFSPSVEGEPMRVYLDIGALSWSGIVTYQELKPASFNKIIGGFVEALLELVSLNILVWQIAFYIILFIVSLAFVGVIFGLAFLGFSYAKKLKKQREEGGV